MIENENRDLFCEISKIDELSMATSFFKHKTLALSDYNVLTMSS
jgi:hypothetical protein